MPTRSFRPTSAQPPQPAPQPAPTPAPAPATPAPTPGTAPPGAWQSPPVEIDYRRLGRAVADSWWLYAFGCGPALVVWLSFWVFMIWLVIGGAVMGTLAD